MDWLWCFWNLLWSFLKSEAAAAWTQAIFSVVAIVVAYRIARQEHKENVRREADEAARREKKTGDLCRACTGNLVLCCNDIAQVSRGDAEHVTYRKLQRLNDLVELARSIDIREIPNRAAEIFISIRSLASEAAAELEHFRHAGGAFFHHDMIGQRFSVYHDAFLQKYEDLEAALVGVQLASVRRTFKPLDNAPKVGS